MYKTKNESREIVEGYYLKTLTGKDYIELMGHTVSEEDPPAVSIRSMAEFCVIGIVDCMGGKIHATADEWLDEPFELIELCGNAIVSAITSKNIEDKKGN